ncbi:sulfotransferase 1A1-like [Oratosquilla oratoria]|uniref:sulfotransferase 1A1-like n=1 Tax=Oratosquilla oratoria TaxID=337810 RepID=UPI003F773CA5
MATQLANGYRVTEVEDELKERVRKFFSLRKSDLIRLDSPGWLLPKRFLKFADRLYGFKFKKDDVIIMTWPKCGTKWMQEIIWTMRNNPNFDNPAAKTSVHLRCPFMDFDMIVPPSSFGEGGHFQWMLEFFEKKCPGQKVEDGVFLPMAENLEEPRTIKCHLPFSFLSPELLQKAKTVIVVRNPKDVCVSYHHHCCLTSFQGFCGSLDDFVDFFVNDELNYSPYWTYMKEIFEKREHSNVHLVFFEDLKANPFGELKRLDAFLGTSLTDDQINKVVEYTRFDAMKERDLALNQKPVGYNEEVFKRDGGLLRKGEVGNYKKKLSQEQEAKIDAWIRTKSGGLEKHFKYSI